MNSTISKSASEVKTEKSRKTSLYTRLSALLLCLVTVIICAACSYDSADPVIMKYMSSEVTKSLYSYWLSTYKSSFLYAYNSGVDSDEFWDTMISENQTYEDYITEWVNTEVKYRTVALKLFDEYKLELSDSEIQAIDDDIAEKIEYAGSREEVNTELAGMGMNIDMLREVYIANAKYDAVYDHLYGTNGTDLPTQSELAGYYSENYYCLKYITIYSGCILSTDEDGNYLYDEDGNIQLEALTDEQKEEKQKIIDTIVVGIEAGGNFEEYMDEFSEVDYSNYPNGFFVSENDYSKYGSDIISAAIDMKVGETKCLSDDNVTYILKKYELPEYSSLSSTDTEQLSSISDYVIREKYVALFGEYVENVTVDTDLLSEFSIRSASKNSYY